MPWATNGRPSSGQHPRDTQTMHDLHQFPSKPYENSRWPLRIDPIQALAFSRDYLSREADSLTWGLVMYMPTGRLPHCDAPYLIIHLGDPDLTAVEQGGLEPGSTLRYMDTSG